MKTVKELWVNYSDMVLPKPCADIQYRETRLAFYAGVYSFLTELREIDEHVSDDEGVMRMQEYANELELFHKEELNRRKGSEADGNGGKRK